MNKKKVLLKELDRVNLGYILAYNAIERFYSQISEKAEELRCAGVSNDDVSIFTCSQQSSAELCQLQDREEYYSGLRRNIERELRIR